MREALNKYLEFLKPNQKDQLVKDFEELKNKSKPIPNRRKSDEVSKQSNDNKNDIIINKT